jgi:predicted nucleic acid-binding protein
MEKMKFYLDSNVFIFAALSKEKIGEVAREALRNLEKFTGVINSLVIDEIIWNIKKEISYQTAIDVSEKIFELPLKILSVNPETVFRAFEFMKKYGIKPRDAIHVASMLENSIPTIVTEDSDFKKVREIKTLTISELARKF